MVKAPIFKSPADTKARFLETAVNRAQLAMIASDVSEAGQPIIFANEAFAKLTGYSQDEILGRNCSFLQGERTSAATVEAMRSAIANGEEGYFEVLNYKKDGTPFWNGLHIGPASAPDGDQTLFFGSQRDITMEVEARQLEAVRMEELRHRMGNLMAIVGVIVKNSNEGEDVKSMQEILQGRIAALGAATELIYPKVDTSAGVTRQALEPKTVRIRTIIGTIIKPLGSEEKFTISGPPTPLPEQQTTNLSLALHELSINAAKHGALAHANGHVAISWRNADGRILVDWIETGCELSVEPERRGLGRRLLDSMIAGSEREDAGLQFEPSGVSFRFDVPAGPNT